MINIFSSRLSYLMAFVVTLIIFFYCVYLEKYLGLEPCALCELQRIILSLLGFLFLLGALLPFKKLGKIILGLVSIFFEVLGIIFASRQIWLQYLPHSNHDSCAASLQYMLKVLSFNEAITHIFNGSIECSKVTWTLCALSVPEWSLIGFTVFLLFSIWQTVQGFRKK